MNRRFLKLLDWKAGNIYLSLLKYIWGSDVYEGLLRTLGCHRGPQNCFPKWTCYLSFLPARPVAPLVTWFGKWHINHSVSKTRTLGSKFDSFSQSIHSVDHFLYKSLKYDHFCPSYCPIRVQSITSFTYVIATATIWQFF